MALPALRRPKCVDKLQEKVIPPPFNNKNVIITLKSDKKLVVPCDAYNGIILSKGMYKCVFCKMDIQLDEEYKNNHKNRQTHKDAMFVYPHLDDFGENLIRKLGEGLYYCTVCNATVSSTFLSLHISSEGHSQKHVRATTQASIYKPID